MNLILDLDRALLIAINGWNSPFLDKLMILLSSIPIWIPLYVAIATFFFFPKYYGKKSFIHTNNYDNIIPFWVIGLMGIAAIGICFGLCDQVSVIIKNSVERFRPSHELDLYGVVRLINQPGSLYGFVSSHAANTFGLAILSSLIVKRTPYTIGIILWAAIVSYSRVYLAAHYPLDVICGAALGIVIAVLIYQLWIMAIREMFNYFHRKRCSVS
jgi:undecaprenyl-diphosphatase